ncbi:MAG TPA: hypothetical protein VIJ34_02025 [Acidimicrobiales bacterium]
MIDHRPPYSLSARGLDGMHRLKFSVRHVQTPDGSDSDKRARSSSTEKRDGRVEKTFHGESMNMPGRSDLLGIGQVPVENDSYILVTRILDSEDDVRRSHEESVTAQLGVLG